MRVIEVSVSCGITGFESPAKDYAQKELCLDELLIEVPSASKVYQVQNDDLCAIGIFNGDLVVADQSKSVNCGDLIVAKFNGELLCSMINTRHHILYTDSEFLRFTAIQEFDEFVNLGVVTRSVRCFHPIKES